MITLHFSECGQIPGAVGSEIRQPIYTMDRGPYYEERLRRAIDGDEFITYDELCVLVAQYLRRKEKLPIRLVSWCGCDRKYPVSRVIELDDDGDMIDDAHHRFFNQRMKYLR